MKILFIYSLMFSHRTWQRAAERLAEENIQLYFAQLSETIDLLTEEESKGFDLLIAEISPGMPEGARLLEQGRIIYQRVGIAPEMPADFSTFTPDTVARFRDYLKKVHLNNFVNGIRYLAAQTGMAISYAPPQMVQTIGIYHPEATLTFDDVDDYRIWHAGRFKTIDAPWIGLLFYYSQWVEQNTADVDALILNLEAHGLAPLCVFCAGAEDHDDSGPDGPQWLTYFQQAPKVELVLSFMAGRLLKNSAEVHRLERLDVPVMKLLRAHSQTPDQWQADPAGLPAMTAVFSFSQPELFGAVAPMVIAGTKPPAPGQSSRCFRTFIPIRDRMEILCRRVQRWVRLRRLANGEKRVTIVLHNNPCKGVEGTIGMAVGLDTFESLALTLKEMKTAGYDVGHAPQTGQEILNEIMTRKALSEFRWTTVEEIVAKRGHLHLMDGEEYLPWFNLLTESAKSKVAEDWEGFPGQSMAYNHNGREVLVITGICYGNIRIMVQPKRGCYGPKCTGEVCRILHDPELSPPHHWLATYKYIQENSDAVVHFGTEGSLEFLPGKQIGLSNACFPEISIGDLPNLYVYAVDVTGEGLTAKRRGQAVLVDHLTPVYRPTPLTDEMHMLEDLLEQYQKSEAMQEAGRKDLLAEEISPLLVACGLVPVRPDHEQLSDALSTAGRQLASIKRALMPEGLHRLSVPPPKSGVARQLATLLQSPPAGLPDTETLAEFGSDSRTPVYERAAGVIESLLDTEETAASITKSHPELTRFCRDVADRMARCSCEIERLLHGLTGGFIPPGLSGSVSQGKIDALPTGRNFFATDVTALPTPAAWEMGKQLADKLLVKYWTEENAFPESVGINIWSGDAFKSDGELLCQILYLMGARPVWDSQGKVSDVTPIALEKLGIQLPDGTRQKRPRVDVTVQTSSIMRDLVPNFCELMDRAVVLVSRLNEPLKCNFIRKHTEEQMAMLRKETAEELGDAHIRRLATLRVFSSAPGTYGLGVGLALDASAWQVSQDLAEVYINWGGHAYGTDAENGDAAYGINAQQLFSDQLARLDVTYMKQTSAEYDVLDCGCYAVAMGGMATAAKAVGAKMPKLYWGDGTVPAHTEVTSLSAEIEKSARVKLLNPHWIRHMQDYGYQGAQAVSSRVNNLFKWSATSGKVSKELFDQVVKTYILDEEKCKWLQELNPYAMEEITRRLLEAHSRGLWRAEEDLLEKVQSTALAIEGDMEEIMGDTAGEFQGNKVEVLLAGEVEKWQMAWRIERVREDAENR